HRVSNIFQKSVAKESHKEHRQVIAQILQKENRDHHDDHHRKCPRFAISVARHREIVTHRVADEIFQFAYSLINRFYRVALGLIEYHLDHRNQREERQRTEQRIQQVEEHVEVHVLLVRLCEPENLPECRVYHIILSSVRIPRIFSSRCASTSATSSIESIRSFTLT